MIEDINQFLSCCPTHMKYETYEKGDLPLAEDISFSFRRRFTNAILLFD